MTSDSGPSNGRFRPIPRARLIERFRDAFGTTVTLIVAPAGYGKSTALSQFLGTQSGAIVRYNVLATERGLLGFVRGFVDELATVAPDARRTLASAFSNYERSESPGLDVARWLHAHLSEFHGIVAIDDSHVVQSDPEFEIFLAAIVELTGDKIHWILASRVSAGLPMATWLAYGACSLPIDDLDLRFSEQEAREVVARINPALPDAEVSHLVALTEGWPTALQLAVNSSTRQGVDREALLSRDLLYRYFASEVVNTLSDEERAFLETAAFLPEIDVDVMVRSGFDRAFGLLEELRVRGVFVTELRAGVYRLHDLFREHLLQGLERRGRSAVIDRARAVADALVATGGFAVAMPLLVRAGEYERIATVINNDGLRLLDHGFSDTLRQGIDALPAQMVDDTIRGLSGLLLIAEGQLELGESTIRRALRGAVHSHLRSELAFRLAIFRSNRLIDEPEVLEALLREPTLTRELRLETRSFLLFTLARSKRVDEARAQLSEVHAEFKTADVSLSDEVRARVLLRMGTSAHTLGERSLARTFLAQAAELAKQIGLWTIASRAHRCILSVVRDWDDDIRETRHNAEEATSAAAKSGDFYDLQHCLLVLLSLHTQQGDSAAAQATSLRIEALKRQAEFTRPYLTTSLAHREMWARKYGDAFRLFSLDLGKQPYATDRAIYSSCWSLAAALADVDLSRDGENTLARFDDCDLEAVPTSVAMLIFIAAEAVRGRYSAARKLLARVPDIHAVVQALKNICVDTLVLAENPAREAASIKEPMRIAEGAGYLGFARHLENAHAFILERRASVGTVALTAAETSILNALVRGDKPKDIAVALERSVLTVNAHIKNIARKLGTHGRSEMIAAAKKRASPAPGEREQELRKLP